MAEFKLTINDTKTGRSYNKTLETDAFRNKKLNDRVEGNLIGIKGYEFEITGGSDGSGFPMRRDMDGTARKKALLTKGIGARIKRRGCRKRKSVAGNSIFLKTTQINMKIIKYGSKKIDEILGLEKKDAAEARTEETKEKKDEGKTEVKPEESKERKNAS